MKGDVILEFFLMEKAVENDMAAIKELIRRDDYTFERGLMAISVAFNKGNNEIAYEMLSLPGAWEHYIASRFSPFLVLDKLEEKVNEHKRCNGYQSQSQ